MPLAFESSSHGTVAFGFFNIESDMLLLERYFFFATALCSRICDLASCKGREDQSVDLHVFDISDVQERGDLMGAIHKVRYQGFIGDTYRKYPFPDRPVDFKQNPNGDQTQTAFIEMITPYSKQIQIPIQVSVTDQAVRIEEYEFTQPIFFELLDYVWRGGYPMWKDGVRPSYVSEMKEKTLSSKYEIFDGLTYSP